MWVGETAVSSHLSAFMAPWRLTLSRCLLNWDWSQQQEPHITHVLCGGRKKKNHPMHFLTVMQGLLPHAEEQPFFMAVEAVWCDRWSHLFGVSFHWGGGSPMCRECRMLVSGIGKSFLEHVGFINWSVAVREWEAQYFIWSFQQASSAFLKSWLPFAVLALTAHTLNTGCQTSYWKCEHRVHPPPKVIRHVAKQHRVHHGNAFEDAVCFSDGLAENNE